MIPYNFGRIYSLSKSRIFPPLEFLSYPNGGSYPSIINWVFRKEQSSFVPKTVSMAMLFFITIDNLSNLFLIDLTFMCPILILLILNRRILFKHNVVSSVCYEVLTGRSKMVFLAELNNFCLIIFFQITLLLLIVFYAFRISNSLQIQKSLVAASLQQASQKKKTFMCTVTR